jgi:Uma2 family endonuclease
MSVFPVRHSVSVDEFERMVEAGVFAPDERLELIDGEILDMSPIGDPHMACVDRLTRWFAPLTISERAIVRVQGAFVASDISRPQPDVALLRPRDDFYATRGPRPADVILAVEVADSSLRYDREVKRSLYAAAGVSEMWIVDLKGGGVDIATEPSASGYANLMRAKPGDTIAPAAFPDVTLAVAQLFGRPPSTPA